MTETWTTRVYFALHRAVAKLSYGLTKYRHPARRTAFATIMKIKRSIPTATTPLECVELFNTVAACEKVQGDLAEVGVYRGGTAAIMLSASGKRLHLFDTFEGLPHGDEMFASGEWRGSMDQVRSNLIDWRERTRFHPGLFPESARGCEDLRFSCVHLDLDLYDSTLAALEWFWPRIEKGGVIFSHDYPYSAGVVKAFHEFFDSLPMPFFPLSGNQCMAVKF